MEGWRMEFSYRISKAEFLIAYNLRHKYSLRSWKRRLFWFWCSVLIGFILLWVIVQRTSPPAPVSQHPAIQHTAPTSTKNDWAVYMEPAAILGVWVFGMFIFPRLRLDRMYRRDPQMQGQFTVNITPDSISTQNTAGTLSKTGWNVYDYWREKKEVIVLVFHLGAFLPVSLASLSEFQRAELRGILNVALPKKRFSIGRVTR